MFCRIHVPALMQFRFRIMTTDTSIAVAGESRQKRLQYLKHVDPGKGRSSR